MILNKNLHNVAVKSKSTKKHILENNFITITLQWEVNTLIVTG